MSQLSRERASRLISAIRIASGVVLGEDAELIKLTILEVLENLRKNPAATTEK